jgi:hypothetical protein
MVSKRSHKGLSPPCERSGDSTVEKTAIAQDAGPLERFIYFSVLCEAKLIHQKIEGVAKVSGKM